MPFEVDTVSMTSILVCQIGWMRKKLYLSIFFSGYSGPGRPHGGGWDGGPRHPSAQQRLRCNFDVLRRPSCIIFKNLDNTNSGLFTWVKPNLSPIVLGRYSSRKTRGFDGIGSNLGVILTMPNFLSGVSVSQGSISVRIVQSSTTCAIEPMAEVN